MLSLRFSLWTIFLAFHTLPCQALSIAKPLSPQVGRRAFVATSASLGSLLAFTSNAPPSSAAAASKIGQRLQNDQLAIPPPSYASELNGVDNTYFPSYLAGTWDVTQTLTKVQTPLGLRFAGGPNGDLNIAQASMAQTSQQINRPVQLQLRYLPTKWGVAEDRLFNTRQRLNAFAGKSVVANVEYANVGGSNRASVLAMGGRDTDPLQTTVIRFKGPAAQKSFLVSHGGDPLMTQPEGDDWAGYELQRAIFALTNQNQAPPITTDSELIWKFHKLDDNHIEAKFRIAEYLNAQQDRLYFEAGKKAVTLQDYTLKMTRVAD